MAVNKTDRYNWQAAGIKDAVRFRKPSPNLVAAKDWLIKRFGGTSVGIYNNREVRGGGAPSSHKFGAALDWRYTDRRRAMEAMKMLVAHSEEFGVQMIVDYVGSTIWTPTKGWKKHEPNKHGMGQAWAKWLHVETTKTKWADGSRWDGRL